MPVILSELKQMGLMDTVANQVAKQLAIYMGLPDGSDVQLRNESRRIPTPQGIIEALGDKLPLNEQTQARLVMTYTEEFDESNLAVNTSYTKEFPPLFSIPELGLDLRGAYSKTNVTFQGIVTTKSRSEIHALRRRLQMRAQLRSALYRHTLQYPIDLPDSYVFLLFDCFKMQESNHGYGETLAQFLDRGDAGGGLTRRYGQGKDQRVSLYVQQEQVRSLGGFDDAMFHQSVETTEEGHQLTFQYSLAFVQPVGLKLTYPLFVHQRRLPDQYIQAWQPYALHFAVEQQQATVKTYIPAQDQRHYQADGGIRLDPFDEWFPKSTVKGTRTELLTPVVMETEDPYMVGNLQDLVSVGLDQQTVDLLLRYPDLVNEPYALPFSIEVWEIGKTEGKTEFTVSPGGDIRTVRQMDPRQRHYLRVTRLDDLSLLMPSLLEDLLNDPSMLEHVLSGLLPDVNLTDTEKELTMPVAGGKVVHHRDFYDCIRKIPATNAEFKRIIPGHLRMVNTITPHTKD